MKTEKEVLDILTVGELWAISELLSYSVGTTNVSIKEKEVATMLSRKIQNRLLYVAYSDKEEQIHITIKK